MQRTTIPVQPPRQIASQAVAADRLGVNERTIRRYVAAGKLTAYRLGPRLIRVDLAEVDQLLRPIPTATV